jgi:molybdate transport system regulatory protein
LLVECVPKSSNAAIKIRLRVSCGNEDAFGPGKAQLLESLLETNSLNQTASALKMSYVKALALVRAMNAHFRGPLVELSRGGREGGGAKVTQLGREVLADYHRMREAADKSVQSAWRQLRRRLKSG